MTPITDAEPQSRSADLVAEHVARIAALFPDAVTEGKVDFHVLRQLLGGAVEERDEKYGLNWHGKRQARQLALTPSTGTLRPAPDDSVDWDNTRNLFIEGDNLEVLKLLQKSYSGRVKLLYIDPPYNTGGDFIYPDDFRDGIENYKRVTGQVDGEGQAITSNLETSGRFHTDWLNMMYPRLKLARNLLGDDGLAIVHIDEHEVSNLDHIMCEVFGEENRLGICVWDKRNPKGDAQGIAYQHESILVFAKDAEAVFEKTPLRKAKRNARRMLDEAARLFGQSKDSEVATSAYRKWIRNQEGLSGGEAMYDRISADGRVYRLVSMAWPNKKKAPDAYFKPLVHPITKKSCPIPERGWRNPPETMQRLLTDGLIEFGPDETTQPQRRYYLDENMFENVASILSYGGSDDDLFREWGIPFEQPKPMQVATSLIACCTSGNDIILDCFAGSGTTGHAVMAQNAADSGARSYILVQLPEPLDAANKDQRAGADFCKRIGKPPVIAEITKERLRRAATKVKKDSPLFSGDTGFRVYKLDKSNIRPWNPHPADLGKTLFDSVDHLEPGRTEADVMAELLLKLGLDLCVPVETKTIAGKTVYSVGGGVLIVCLAPSVTAKQVEPLALGIVEWHKALAPAGDSQAVFRDAAFADDVAKTNLTAILAQHGLTNVRSL